MSSDLTYLAVTTYLRVAFWGCLFAAMLVSQAVMTDPWMGAARRERMSYVARALHGASLVIAFLAFVHR